MKAGRVLRLRYLSRNVSNLARAIAFYRDALDFQLIAVARVDSASLGVPGMHADVAQLQLGQQALELVAFDSPGRPYPGDSGSNDLWFQHLAIVVADMREAYRQLCRHAFQPISEDGPQRLPPNTGSVSAFKFRDPDGHPLELIHFPVTAGNARWAHHAGLFLGIDHSAIAVTDAQRSLAFYTSLGFQAGVRSDNSGPAQQRLDGLPSVEVDVIGLQPARAEPPHLELLAYRVPPGRSPSPPAAAIDLAADRLVVQFDDAANASAYHDQHSTTWPLLQDPDGHRLLMQASIETDH
ncbi:VOC family protein [Dyella jejuensis]|uniref:VOC family protein n=1 Tax=Dyella jejuensis TaxID=1432009 RepID=A0ABW8JHS4_9GAMM